MPALSAASTALSMCYSMYNTSHLCPVLCKALKHRQVKQVEDSGNSWRTVLVIIMTLLGYFISLAHLLGLSLPCPISPKQFAYNKQSQMVYHPCMQPVRPKVLIKILLLQYSHKSPAVLRLVSFKEVLN